MQSVDVKDLENYKGKDMGIQIGCQLIRIE